MPVNLVDDKFILSQQEVEGLWQEVIARRQYMDETVTVKSVDEAEITKLNRTYRQTDKPTNVLTFSYGDGEHDIAVCLRVAQREAEERGVALKSYVAVLLVHGLLHATGLDHERSAEEAQHMAELEEGIIKRVGFAPEHL